MKIIHQKVNKQELSPREIKSIHNGVKSALSKVSDEYVLITTPTELILLDDSDNEVRQLIKTEGAIYDINDMIPEAIELYKEAYKSPPIGEDVDSTIIEAISDFRESLNQGIKESSTVINRLLNESEEQYIIDTLMEKGYREPFFLRNRYTEDSTIVEYTRIQMCM